MPADATATAPDAQPLPTWKRALFMAITLSLPLVLLVDTQIGPAAAFDQQHDNGNQRRQGKDQQQPNNQSIGDRCVRHYGISRNR